MSFALRIAPALRRGPAVSAGHGRAGCASPGTVFASCRTDQNQNAAISRLWPESESTYQPMPATAAINTPVTGAQIKNLRRQRLHANTLNVRRASLKDGLFPR